jgi:hypothetical protein
MHADGAAGHALGFGVERTPQRREHIGAGAPIGADGQRKLGEAGLDMSCLVERSLSPITAERDLRRRSAR